MREERADNTDNKNNNTYSSMYLCTRTADEIRTLLREEHVSPEKLIQQVETRIQQVNGQVHAVITPCFERARVKLTEIQKHMRDIRARGAKFPPGYLYGMPVLIKDDSYVRGVRFTLGFYLESEDEEHVKRRQLMDSDPVVLQVGG